MKREVKVVSPGALLVARRWKKATKAQRHAHAMLMVAGRRRKALERLGKDRAQTDTDGDAK